MPRDERDCATQQDMGRLTRQDLQGKHQKDPYFRSEEQAQYKPTGLGGLAHVPSSVHIGNSWGEMFGRKM